MAILTTGDLHIPTTQADGIWKKTVTESVVARLSGAEPQKFGNVDIMTLTGRPKAEFVGAGQEKSSSDASFGLVSVKPHKVQVTLRFDEEVQWADEDHQLGVLQELSNSTSVALSRALDLGVIHRINPLTGAVYTGIEAWLDQTSNRVVTSGAGVDLDLEAAAGLVVANGFTPRGVALDNSYAWQASTARFADGRKKFPELGLGLSIQNFLGLQAAVGDTVSGRPEASDTLVRAILGDWSLLRWGVQRRIPVELIKFGDPDGQGDLKRKNQIALRAEVVYGWGILDPQGFAIVEEGPVTGATVYTLGVSDATGGTFTVSVNGNTSAPIAYDANAAAVQTAINGIAGVSGVTVSGTTSKTVVFTAPVSATANGAGLEGEGAAVTITAAG